jgi:hypothetical protein
MGEDKKRGGRGEVKVLRIASRCSQHKLKITNTMYFYSFIHKSHARFAVFSRFPLNVNISPVYFGAVRQFASVLACPAR